jgi:hypothetical protein
MTIVILVLITLVLLAAGFVCGIRALARTCSKRHNLDGGFK